MQMLPKLNRLTKKKDFDAVFKRGKSSRSAFLVIKMLKNNLGKTRVGFIVSKKVSNKATARNKVKRRLRVAILNELKMSNESADIVVIALPGIQNKDFEEIQKTVASIIK